MAFLNCRELMTLRPPLYTNPLVHSYYSPCRSDGSATTAARQIFNSSDSLCQMILGAVYVNAYLDGASSMVLRHGLLSLPDSVAIEFGFGFIGVC